MTDRGLRQLQRTAETLEDYRALLVARMRAGDSEARVRLELAAYMGDQPSRSAAPPRISFCHSTKPCSCGWHLHQDGGECTSASYWTCGDRDLRAWVRRILPFTTQLPHVRGRGEKDCLGPYRRPDRYPCSNSSLGDCMLCDGTGRVPYSVSATHYAFCLVAATAAQKALSGWAKGKWRHWQRWNLTRIPESKRAAKREKFHATDPSLQHSRKILRAGWAWIETPCEEHAANLLKIRRPPDPFISYFMALVAADMDLTGAVETVVGSSRTYCKTDVLRRSIRSCVVRWALTGVAPVPAEQVTE